MKNKVKTFCVICGIMMVFFLQAQTKIESYNNLSGGARIVIDPEGKERAISVAEYALNKKLPKKHALKFAYKGAETQARSDLATFLSGSAVTSIEAQEDFLEEDLKRDKVISSRSIQSSGIKQISQSRLPPRVETLSRKEEGDHVVVVIGVLLEDLKK